MGLISGGKDGNLYAWAVPLNPKTHTVDATACEDGMPCVGTLVGQGASVGGVAVSPSGRRCLGGGWDGSLRLWQVPDVSEVFDIQQQQHTRDKKGMGIDGGTVCGCVDVRQDG